MAMEVLQNRLQIVNARQELVKKGTSFVDSPLQALLRRIRLVDGVAVGDEVKSWDVLSTLKFIEDHVHKHEPILDIGCYASEVLLALHKLGYSDLTGVDLNPKIRRMPHQDSIRYEVADFTRTTFERASFRAITSISVIEHGFHQQILLEEMARLLTPAGYFIASFDYWPVKIDTTGTSFFGMDWQIFSKQDVADFVEEAAKYGLVPIGDLMNEGAERVINCAGKQYTFAWLVLHKSI
jgi:SAM-dependent methyltransferase